MHGVRSAVCLIFSLLVFSGIFFAAVSADETANVTSLSVAATATPVPAEYPVMYMSKARLDEEEARFQALETYAPVHRRMLMADSLPPAKSLLSYLSYVPAERSQGTCGDCWVWASTGALEIENAVKTGIKERLSIQYFNSNYENGEGAEWACCGGSPDYFSSWYDAETTLIPWSNTNAGFGDASRTCEMGTAVPAISISPDPHSHLNSLSTLALSTTGGQAAAIAAIRGAIDNNKAVYYSYSLNSTTWDIFRSYWGYENESVVWDPDTYGNQEYGGGHGVLIVGYDTTDTANPYWIVLNSWGASSERPNGLFRVRMDMNYDATVTYDAITYPQHRFYVLDAAFPNPAPNISGIVPEYGRNSTPVFIANLTGTGFYGTPAVKLNRTGYPDIPATSASVVSATDIACTFPLAGNPVGVYSVVVTNPDGQQGVLVNGFTVVDQVPPTIGVFRNTTHRFYLDENGDGILDGAVTDRLYNFGLFGDLPVAGDWNGDGTTEIGVFRNTTHMFYLDYNGNGLWNGSVTDRMNNFGLPGDLPVAGDWNGDNTTEIGVFRNSTHRFYLDTTGNGLWGAGDSVYAFGLSGDLPVAGDWNSDGKDEIGVFRPAAQRFYLDTSGNGLWGNDDTWYSFGLFGDRPVAGVWG